MEQWAVAAFIFAAVASGVGAQAWVSWLDHKRRSKALDVIKAAIDAGREPPQQLYEHLETNDVMASMGLSKRPWGEAALFAIIAIGFWIAYAYGASSGRQDKFLLVAAIMSAAAIGCAALAAFRSRRRKPDDEQ